jgi:uroporphyrinogen III methyltransferase/synthase
MLPHQPERLALGHNRPLLGKTFLVTRSTEQAGEFARLLNSQGGSVLECPTIQIVPAESLAELDSALINLGAFDWVVFTSQNTVSHFLNRLATLGCDNQALSTCRICAVGPKTAELLQAQDVTVHLVPDKYTAEGVVEAFSGVKERRRVLLPRGDRARPVIMEGLKQQGHQVAAPILYRNLTPSGIPEQVLRALAERRVDCVIFSAPSTATNLAQILGEPQFHDLLQGVTVAAIGPITSRACNKLALEVQIEAREHTLPALVEDIVHYYREKPG